MTNTQSETIRVWETIEVERSSSEAKRRSSDDLALSNDVIQRYLAPSKETFYPLEYAYHLLGDVSGKTVLDYGCGAGENSVLIASHGARVIGVDISPELLELAERRMELSGLTNFEFKVGSAHELPLEAESVDVVYGMAILHHLDLELASKEVFRVLKKGGRAIFFEPVRDSKLAWFVRKLIPYQSPDVSPYERPLTEAELRAFSREFSGFQMRAFWLPFVTLTQAIGLSDNLFHYLVKVDGKMLRWLPLLKKFATIRVFEIQKN